MGPVTYWHWTCSHRAAKIAATGVLQPNPHPVLRDLPITWLTTSRLATRAALGLSSKTLSCDRMSHLFQVEEADEPLVLSWTELKAEPAFEDYLPMARRLEAVRGTRPVVWAVTLEPVHVFEVALPRQ